MRLFISCMHFCALAFVYVGFVIEKRLVVIPLDREINLSIHIRLSTINRIYVQCEHLLISSMRTSGILPNQIKMHFQL